MTDDETATTAVLPTTPGVCPVCGKPATVDLVDALATLQDPVKAGRANVPGRALYAYLELPDLLRAVRTALGPHHLAVMQHVTNDGGTVTVTTVLLHASGVEFASPALTLRCGASAQDIGSASTYARRYSLAAFVGLAGSDDDDAPTVAPPADRPAPVYTVSRPNFPPDKPGTASDASRKAMWTMLRKTGMDAEQIRGWVASTLGIEGGQWSTADLSQRQVSKVIDKLKSEEPPIDVETGQLVEP